ncbi:YhcN/YlaJ family sporulation lipoprotein [Serpentinicella alkaliphila]|uniref:YhcN/YlaJ family sporulation lipoprotein n=1 Tax=Serpentinicella alkaliphila TaxID=1734049 RepID=A0A4R2TVR6_9FIRM|nr:YhcN/YlaJ family sporulation lipoprotein [Serpentinicella alkaliphila]QUH26781.1 YhcN/YlaJ family sporulation lipoprotein [Serpentinicella alkaliphila]TCQ08001.1 YhcN/YlaJ family sporulation lipoprotein [Serpentinicella alkaliphila]
MSNRKLIIALCLVMVFAVFATGCRPLERPVPRDPHTDEEIKETTPRMDARGGDGNLTARAERIADAVAKMEEVRSAYVVITDTTALVGVALAGNTNDVATDLKRRIEDVVTKTDREIDRVAVTADPDLITRIRNVADETGRGRPLSGFGREVEEILRRIIPNA